MSQLFKPQSYCLLRHLKTLRVARIVMHVFCVINMEYASGQH